MTIDIADRTEKNRLLDILSGRNLAARYRTHGPLHFYRATAII